MFAVSFVLIYLIEFVFGDQHLWFENAPPFDDPCTLVVIGGNRGDLRCHHIPSFCKDHGGFIHWANYGRTWLHLYIDNEKKQEFELCLTSGSADRTYIWYDYAQQHWEPMVHDAWYGLANRKDACKKSINGTMDLFFEAPWWFVNYVAYVSWNITEIEDYQPKPWPPVKKSQDHSYDNVDEGAAEFAPEFIKKKKEEKEKEEKAEKKKGKKKRRKRKNKGNKKQAKEDKQVEEKSEEKSKEKDKKERPKPAWK